MLAEARLSLGRSLTCLTDERGALLLPSQRRPSEGSVGPRISPRPIPQAVYHRAVSTQRGVHVFP